MHYDPQDTIAAIGTAAGGALRGMIRISGPQMQTCLASCFRPLDRTTQLTDVRLPSVIEGKFHCDDLAIPCDLFLWPTQRSYTRQPTAELHTFGSPPLLEAILRTVCSAGARLAQPGEFTLRAFLAGRLDLTQAEAVLGVIDAHSETNRQTALAQLAGGLSQPLGQLREQLLQLLAELEAGLDFVDEDIEFITSEQLVAQLTTAQKTVNDIRSQLHSREDATSLPRIVLAGPPNAGKSSLFNALVERYPSTSSVQRALVSDQAGTTRDFVTTVVQFGELACQLIDTAGIEALADEDSIESSAQEMTGRQRAQASLVLWCQDIATADSTLTSFDATKQIVIHTKCDLANQLHANESSAIACSSVTGAGLEQLVAQVVKLLSNSSDSGSVLANTSTRCADSLLQADELLTCAVELAATDAGEELVAAEVRSALNALGQVVGTVYTDDILDRIFGQFCIGK